MILPHLMVAEDGRVIYCNQPGFSFADQFDDQGRWVEGYHIWTCDGREVFRQTFTSEAADLGLPELQAGSCTRQTLDLWGSCSPWEAYPTQEGW